jgi:hypothetical protein
MLITRFCSVKPPEIFFNGSVIFSSELNDPAGFMKAAYRRFYIQYPKFFKMDNLCKLAFLSAEILLKDTSVTSRHDSEYIGIILQNSSSSLETDEKHQQSISDRANYFPSPSVFVYTLPNIMAGEIAIRHKIKGENTVFISESPDIKLLYQTVNELFSSKKVSCCIAGWIESYHGCLQSCLMLVENEENANSAIKPEEITIFEPLTIENIFKEAIQDGTDRKAKGRDY